MSSSPNRFSFPLAFVQGDSFALSLQLTDMTVTPSVPKNLTGWGVAFIVKNPSGHIIINLTTNTGNASVGQLIFVGTPANGKQFVNNATYRIIITSPDGTQVITVMIGTITIEPASSTTQTSSVFDVLNGTLEVDFQQIQMVFNLQTIGGVAGFLNIYSSFSLLPAISTVKTNSIAYVGSNLEVWIAGVSAWTDTGIKLVGSPGAPGAPGVGSGLAFTRQFVFGDSYGASSFPGTGDFSNSNGPTYPAVLDYLFGFPLRGRWVTGWNNGLRWDNYAVSGSVLYGGIDTHVAQFKTDFSNVVPANSLINFEWTGINDVLSLCSSMGTGVVTATDPLTTFTGFTQPAIGSSVTVTFAAIPTGLVASATPLQWVWLQNGGLYSVGAISGSTVVLTYLGQQWNTSGTTAGQPVAGGNVRWGANQLLDDLMTYLIGLINGLITDGAINIVVSTTIPLGNLPAESSYPNGDRTSAYFNTALESAVSSISQVHVFDLGAAFTAILANPPAYGFYNVDVGISASSDTPESCMFVDSPGLHPSAACHRWYALKWLQWAVGWAPSAPQIQAALALLNNYPNGNPPTFSTPPGVWVASSGASLPVNVTNSDDRLSAASAYQNPSQVIRVFTDLDTAYVDGSSNPIPDASWTAYKVGGATPTYLPSAFSQDFQVFGAIQTRLGNVGDSYGFTKTVSPFNWNGAFAVQTGVLRLLFRIGAIGTGNSFIMRAGLVDALGTARPANGIFCEITDASGTCTGNMVLGNASTYTTFSFPITLDATNGYLKTIEVVSDFELLRYFVYVSGVLAGFGRLPALPNASLYLAYQAQQTVFSTTAFTTVNLDLLGGILKGSPRL